MITLFKWMSVSPLWLLHGLGWMLGWLAFGLSPTYRRRFLANVDQAGLNWHQWRPSVGQSGKLVAELPRLWMGAPVPVQWSEQALERVRQALESGRGLVFLTPHLGCFEVTAQAYAQQFGVRWPMTVLFRPARKPWLREVVAQSRQRPGLLAAPTTLAGVKLLLKALKAGHAVGLLPDQVPPAGQGVMAPFFGRPAYTMTLSVRLIQQTGAAVLLAWGERLSWGRGYRLHVAPLRADLPADVGLAVAAINLEMQALVQQCPGQYLWGYARYKAPRSES